MITYSLTQNKGEKSANAGKWYAHAVSTNGIVDLDALAEHMQYHNTGFSKAMCLGVMTAMVNCIKEMVLDGKRVKIDDLYIFWAGIRQKKGVESEEAFDPLNDIKCIHLVARATGTLNRENLNTNVQYKRIMCLRQKRRRAPRARKGLPPRTKKNSDG